MGGCVPNARGVSPGVFVAVGGVPVTVKVGLGGVPAVAVLVGVALAPVVPVAETVAVTVIVPAVALIVGFAVLVGCKVAVGTVAVGSAVFVGGGVCVGCASRVRTATVDIFAREVATESAPAPAEGKPGRHALKIIASAVNANSTGKIRFMLNLLGLRDHFHELANRIPQHTLGERSNLSMYDLSVRNEQHGRNTLHAILLRPFRVFIRVDFCNEQFSGILFRQLIQNRRHHFARTAPGRPKIYDDRHLRLEYGLLECIVGDVDGIFDHVTTSLKIWRATSVARLPADEYNIKKRVI